MVLFIVISAVVALATVAAARAAYLRWMYSRQARDEAIAYSAAERIRIVERETVREMLRVAAQYELHGREAGRS